MKRSWMFIVGCWTGVIFAFFSLFLNVLDITELGAGYSAFSKMLAEMSGDKIFPIGLYGAFLIISFVASLLSLGFLVLDEFKILHVDENVLRLIKLIAGAVVAFIGILTFIFGCCYVGSVRVALGDIGVLGGSPIILFIGTLLCGGALVANVFLNKEPAKEKKEEIKIVDAE